MRPGSLAWFAAHELRLSWREFLDLVTAGRRRRKVTVLAGAVVFVAVMHGIAFLALRTGGAHSLSMTLSTLIAVTAAMLLSGAAMLSQAIENVTRVFYARSDLELILSSPAPAHRLFAVRLAIMAFSTGALSLVLMGPFIDVLVFENGWSNIAGYGAILSLACLACAIAVVVTLTLFTTVGPRRTRLAAQFAAAFVGAGFAIAIQIAAMLSAGTLSRTAFLHSRLLLSHLPGLESALWWPARAALGDVFCLLVLMAISLALFVLVATFGARRFSSCALAANGIADEAAATVPEHRQFRVRGPASTLRRKEWRLLLRDPWLVSQSLMQLLYLLPPALLLWRSSVLDGNALVICVPVLIMAAGQLAGGLAWIAISGEDAPDLVASAPLSTSRLLRAKLEAILCVVGAVFVPFIVALAVPSPAGALVSLFGVGASASSAIAIQLWFRTQARRAHFRRRHTSSRIATLAEAFSSITWAATGAIAASGSVLAAITAFFAIGILFAARRVAPVETRPARFAAA
jgi:ABC-2 type transport system permease protein